MNSLKNQKFQPISSQEMNVIMGGKKQVIVGITWKTHSYDENNCRIQYSSYIVQDLNIFGKPKGDPYSVPDNASRTLC